MRLVTAGMITALAVAVALAFPAVALAVNFTTFVDPHPPMCCGTIGFAFAGNKFVGSVQTDGLNVLYSTDLNGGNVAVFAPTVSIPGGSPSSEHYVSSSLGLGGFPSRDIYVAAGNGIIHINNSGTTSDVFIPTSGAGSLASPVRGILFDAVGTFGGDMLVTTTGGQVYRVNSAGTATLITNLGQDTEGLDIAPLGANFGAFDGQLIVASEGSGLIRAISSAGVVSPVATVPFGPEELTFVPLNLGASGNPIEGWYGSCYTPNVQRAAAGQFSGLQGDVVVTSEFGDHRMSQIHWNGSAFVVNLIGNLPCQPEDGIFVTSTIINPIPNPNPVPLPSTVALIASGLIALAIPRWKQRRAGR